MKPSGSLLGAVAIAAVCVGAPSIGVAVHHGHTQPSAVDSMTPGNGTSPLPTQAAHAIQVMDSLPSKVASGLASQHVVVTPPGRAESALRAAQPSIDPSDAADIASKETGIASGVTPSSAMLANVTFEDYGPQLQPDPSKPSHVDPIINNHRAWVIVYDSAQVPVYGKHGEDSPHYVTQPLVTFVDPDTGEFLAAISY